VYSDLAKKWAGSSGVKRLHEDADGVSQGLYGTCEGQAIPRPAASQEVACVGLTDREEVSGAQGHSGRGVNRPPEFGGIGQAILLADAKWVGVRGTA
jgi:hypothetical protein